MAIAQRREQDRLALTRLAVLKRHQGEQLVNGRRRQAAAEGGDADQGRVIRCPHCGGVLERFAS